MTWEDILKNRRRNIKIPNRPKKDERKYTPSAPAFVDRKAPPKPPKPKELPKIYYDSKDLDRMYGYLQPTSFLGLLMKTTLGNYTFLGISRAYVNMRDTGKYEKNIHYNLFPDLTVEELEEQRDAKLKEISNIDKDYQEVKQDFKNLSKEEKMALPKEDYTKKLKEVFFDKIDSNHPDRKKIWEMIKEEYLEVMRW